MSVHVLLRQFRLGRQPVVVKRTMNTIKALYAV